MFRTLLERERHRGVASHLRRAARFCLNNVDTGPCLTKGGGSDSRYRCISGIRRPRRAGAVYSSVSK
jgi:hypothetical protein